MYGNLLGPRLRGGFTTSRAKKCRTLYSRKGIWLRPRAGCPFNGLGLVLSKSSSIQRSQERRCHQPKFSPKGRGGIRNTRRISTLKLRSSLSTLRRTWLSHPIGLLQNQRTPATLNSGGWRHLSFLSLNRPTIEGAASFSPPHCEKDGKREPVAAEKVKGRHPPILS